MRGTDLIMDGGILGTVGEEIITLGTTHTIMEMDTIMITVMDIRISITEEEIL